jgi:hypothetical protein
LLRSALSLGALSMLAGCDLQDNDSVDKALWAMSRWNDRVQALLFRGDKLAPTYAASQITNPFPSTLSTTRLRPTSMAPTGAWRWHWSRQTAMDAGAPAHLAAGRADHAPYLHRRLERHRPVVGRTAQLFCRRSAPTSRRNTSASSARPLLLQPRHAHGLHPQTILALDFGKEPLPTQYGYPAQGAGADQAGLQESQACGRSS